MPVSRWWAFERASVWERQVGGGGAPLPGPAASVQGVGRLHARELSRAMGQRNLGLVLRRLGRGVRAYAAWRDGAIACYGWVSFASECVGELERPIHPGAGDAYVWNCVTLPEHRRHGLYAGLLQAIAERMGAEGVRRLWIGATLAGRRSVRGFRAAGFRPALRATYVRVGPLSVLRVTPDRALPEELAEAARGLLRQPDDREWAGLLVARRPAADYRRCAAVDARPAPGHSRA
jgi:GNAT superfamily N-acetyltransferase